MKKLLLFLCLAMPIFGGTSTSDPVWITVGSDAMADIRAEFNNREWKVFAKRHLTNPKVSLMRVTEPQMNAISRMMHHKYNRCGGFIVHNSYEQAIAAGHRASFDISARKMAISYALDRASEVNTVMPDLTEQGIMDIINGLVSFNSRYYTTSTSVDSANYLKTQWETIANGRADISVELYNHSWLMPSVVMTITGAWQPQDIVVMGGHLDSTSSTSYAPGADDDASGIATLTEILAAALARGYTPARTIKIMAYAAEEVGLRGSGDLADEAFANGDNIIGVLQLDMTAYQGSADDIYLMSDYTNTAQNNFITNLIDTYTPHTWNTSSSCGYACSDHASWHNNGYPASMPFESSIGQYNSTIHTPNDTTATFGNNASHAIKFARMGLAYMIEMGKGGLNGDAGTDPGPVGGGGPTSTELTNPSTLTNLSGASGAEDRYHIQVPAGASNLQIAISGGSGDCDLYTRFGAPPTTGTYDCRPYVGGNNESCPEANPQEGTYYIMLRGFSSYSGLTLNVSYDAPGGNNPPTSSFTYATNDLTVSFTDTSTDSDGTISSHSWNFGDGNTSTASDPSHSYASAGTYTVTLTVTDNDGASASSNQNVTVATTPVNNPPTSSFTYSASNLVVDFTDTSSDSDGTIASHAWTFGDGNSSSSANPSHSYAAAGTYTVTLTVTDDDGASDASNQNVTVSGGGGGWVVIDSHDFESGWGIWNDGGSDCRRSANDSSFANDGTYCVRLRDNSGTASSMITDNISTGSYSQMRVSFSYYPVSMEGSEDLFLEYNDGGGWVVIGQYISGVDFSNNTRENPSETFSLTSTNGTLRIRCDASGNGDRMYIDTVVIEGQ